MTPTVAADLFRQCLLTVLESAGPLMFAITASAVIFGVIQAATQVQDSAVSFAPKLCAALAVGWICAPWMAHLLASFMQRALAAIPALVAQ